MTGPQTDVTPETLADEVYGPGEPDHLTTWAELYAAQREGRLAVASCGVRRPAQAVVPTGRPICVRCAEIATAEGAGWET